MVNHYFGFQLFSAALRLQRKELNKKERQFIYQKPWERLEFEIPETSKCTVVEWIDRKVGLKSVLIVSLPRSYDLLNT
jgi:hypothetical protein